MTLMLVFLGIVGLFTGFKSLEVLYHFYNLRNQVSYLLRDAQVVSDLELRKRLLLLIKGDGVSLDEQGIVLHRQASQLRVEVPYEQSVSVMFMGKRIRVATVPLRLYVEREFVSQRARTRGDLKS